MDRFRIAGLGAIAWSNCTYQDPGIVAAELRGDPENGVAEGRLHFKRRSAKLPHL